MLPYEMTNEHSMEEYRKKVKEIKELLDKYDVKAIANKISKKEGKE